MSVDHILGRSCAVEGAGQIHPIRLVDYDEFSANSDVLNISRQAFQRNDFLLLDLIIFGLQDSAIVKQLEKVLSLVLKKPIVLAADVNGNMYGFVDDQGNVCVTNETYDRVREVIMQQNLLFEPKMFNDPLAQEWANKVLRARAKGSTMTIEDMVTTVHVYSGISYKEIEQYTIYQLYASFNRLTLLKGYDTGIALKIAGAEKMEVKHYAERLEMFRNPYEDLFVQRDKLGKLDHALGK